jgi:hypothetical protein
MKNSYIINLFEEVQLKVIRENVLLIKHINDPFLQVQLEVVKQNVNFIFYIEDPDPEVACS